VTHNQHPAIYIFKQFKSGALIALALFVLFNPVTWGIIGALFEFSTGIKLGPQPVEPYEVVIRGTEKWTRTCSDEEVSILPKEQIEKLCWWKTYASDYEQKQDALEKAKAAIRAKQHDQLVQDVLAHALAADKQQAEALARNIEEDRERRRVATERCHQAPDSPELAAARLENDGHRIFDPKIPADRKLIYEMDHKKGWCD